MDRIRKNICHFCKSLLHTRGEFDGRWPTQPEFAVRLGTQKNLERKANRKKIRLLSRPCSPLQGLAGRQVTTIRQAEIKYEVGFRTFVGLRLSIGLLPNVAFQLDIAARLLSATLDLKSPGLPSCQLHQRWRPVSP